jgi:hypothetical protein
MDVLLMINHSHEDQYGFDLVDYRLIVVLLSDSEYVEFENFS